MARASVLSTADVRRGAVVDSALTEFARSGYLGTSVATIATGAGISPAYVFKLFPGKEPLFVAALDECFRQVVGALETGASSADAGSRPEHVLDRMGDAYASLIADRRLLMLQVHAQSAADVPEIRAALRRGLERVTLFAKTRSGADDADVQRFIAFGQLCHLIVTTGLDSDSAPWASLIAHGFRHPDFDERL
ncbi:TetR/AcrR family transcriptional regulator [Herbiconiux liangxiaofengii]|uniref:TetR/AcrR family transcriptional regulator n=1 Tax=Herbiconiux liangxiaofengii TaxID=3342795 RepID=UPI0035B71F1A